MADLNCILFGEDPGEQQHFEELLSELPSTHVEAVLKHRDDLDRFEGLGEMDLLVACLGVDGDGVLDTLEKLADPPKAIVLVGPRDRSEWILRAMRLGASEYLSPSVEAHAFASVIESVALAPIGGASQQVAPIISVLGAKGGVGTTVIASQLAGSIQALGHSVCVVDLNLRRGDIALHYDVRPRYSLADVARSTTRADATYLQSIVEEHESGVAILAAPERLEDAELIRPEHVTLSLSLLRTLYDCIVIDLPSHWDEITLSAIDASALVYLVYAYDLPTMAHTRRNLDLFDRLGVDTTRTRLLVNRGDTKGGIKPKEATDFLRREEDVRVPNHYGAVMDAIAAGQPLTVAAPRSPLVGVFDSLARETLEACGIEVPEEERGLFKKLGNLMGGK